MRENIFDTQDNCESFEPLHSEIEYLQDVLYLRIQNCCVQAEHLYILKCHVAEVSWFDNLVCLCDSFVAYL